MSSELQPNIARAGLDLDSGVSQVPQGFLTYALNAVVSGFDGNQISYQNEQGNELCTLLPEDYKVICVHPIIEKSIIVLFLVNPSTNSSEIGIVNILDCTYTTKVNQSCLNFSINHPIKKAVHKITACGTEVYWTDNYNPRRYIDLDNLPFVETIDNCNTNTNTIEIDCNRLSIQPNFSIPQIDYKEVDSEGELVAGSYQFAIQYCNAIGDPYTSYYSVTNPIPINDPNKVTLNFNYTVGAAIRLIISNIDITGVFDYYNIAVIKTINNISSVDLVGTYQIERTNQEVIYTGQNVETIKLTPDDIFEKFLILEKADDVTAVQDILIWSNLTSPERISWQKIANKIELEWESYIEPYKEKQYKDSLISANNKGYFRDEVYAFEICPLYIDGTQGDGFHIPGRASTSYDRELIDSADIPKNTRDCTIDSGAIPRWKVYNTASILGYSAELCSQNNNSFGCKDDCYSGPYNYGLFSYYESESTYPCNIEVWGDLAGKPIRHHKFPDNSLINHFDSSGNIYPLGVRIDLNKIIDIIDNSDLSSSQKKKLAGFKILRGNRANNKSVVAKGIFYNVGKYNKDNIDYFYPNYPYNDLSSDPFISADSNAPSYTPIDISTSTTSSSGTTQTILNDTAFTNYDLYHGVQLSYSGVFHGDKSESKVLEMWKFDTQKGFAEMPNGLGKQPLFNSGPLSVGEGDSYKVDITTTYLKSFDHPGNVDGWEISYFINVTYSGSLNKTITYTPNFQSIGIPDFYTTIRLYGTGVQDGDIELSNISGGTAIVLPNVTQLTGFDTEESKQRFTFHSPDTSFYQPTLGTILKLDEVIYGAAQVHFTEVKNHAKYKFPSLNSYITALAVGVVVGFASGLYGTSDQPFDGSATFTTVQFLDDLIYKLIPRKNFAYQYNSVGLYNKYLTIPQNLENSVRGLEISSYLIPGYQGVGDTHSINNYQRESSVYLKTSSPLLFPSEINSVPQDNSRATLTSLNSCNSPTTIFSRDISAYYGAIKKANNSQYGEIYSYNTIDTGSQFLVGDSGVRTIFGGDCFINKFSFKRKLPFFLDNRVGQPDDSDIFYDELGNVGFPTYWFSTDIQKGSGGNFNIGQLFGVKVNNFDCKPHKFFYDSGKIYLFAYGIPTFFCESEVNVDYRQAYNDKEGDYYPHVGSGIPDDWLQEINVPINNDNTYIYNKSYSKQNIENTFTHLPIDFIPNQNCTTILPNRAIYSDKQFDVIHYVRNNWRIYRPVSYFDFPLNYGKLISLEGVENREIIARFENKSQIYDRLLTIDTSSPKAAYIGNSLLFAGAPPIDYKETDIGFNGTQHKLFLKTEFGNVSVDAKRGNIYLINGTQIKDLTEDKLSIFFSDYLPFQMYKYFPEYDIDNVWKGVGLTGVYESKYKRIIITKLDYRPLYNDIIYDISKDEFSYNGKIISYTDSTYFCNVSFTISYSFITQSWVSFHTYFPNYYIANADYFFSGRNSTPGIWRHNTDITKYNNYYGEIHPYEIEYPFRYKQEDEILQSIRDYTKVLQQIDQKAFVELNNAYFNKCIVYNNQQSSGLRNLVFKEPGNMPQSLQFPRYNSDSIDILYTKSDNFYNFNSIWDITNIKTLPLFLQSCESLSRDKIINQYNMIYSNRSFKKYPIRAKDSKIRLILDNRSDIRLVSQFILEETQPSVK
jgi:hypothetical protein